MRARPLEQGQYSYIIPNEPENAILHGHSTSVNSFPFNPTSIRSEAFTCLLFFRNAESKETRDALMHLFISRARDESLTATPCKAVVAVQQMRG